MAPRNIPWPDEWVDLLRKLHPKGYSASKIAMRINAKFSAANISRNAVIGKVLRLRLERDETINERNRAAGREGGNRNRVSASRRPKTQFGKGVCIPTPSAPPPPPPPIPTVHVSTFTGAIIPGPTRIPPQPFPAPAKALGPLIDIHAITTRTCCWPVERGGEFDEWLFCGQARDPKSGVDRERGYCTAHWRKSVSVRRAA